MNSIKVTVFRRKNRAFYEAQWRDPLTGVLKQKSTGEKIRKAAERFAGRLEKELTDGTYKPANAITWADFRERYETEKVASLAAKTVKKIWATLGAFERHINPGRLATVTTAIVNRFQSKMRTAGLAESSIKSHLAHLRAALRWAHRQGMLVEIPHFDMPKRAKTAKHRALTGEEIDRMIAAIWKVATVEQNRRRTRLILKIVRYEHATGRRDATLREQLQECRRQVREIIASWMFLIEGLSASGLRLSESLHLTWDDERMIRLDFSSRHPMLVIPAEMQKNHKNQICPCMPEFCQLLDAVPQADRTGFVFNPQPMRPERSSRLSEIRVCRVIADIGRTATVGVSVDSRTGEVQYASAHDLRRAFCYLWSRKVMPAVLKELARHASVTTTLEYYATGTAEATAAMLWEAAKPPATDTFTDNHPNQDRPRAQRKAEVTASQ